VPAPCAGTEPLPQQEGQQEADEADEHQDPAHHVHVDRRVGVALIHCESEDPSHRDQDEADGYAHGSSVPATAGCQTGSSGVAARIDLDADAGYVFWA